MANDLHSSGADQTPLLTGNWEFRITTGIQALLSVLALCFAIASLLMVSDHNRQTQDNEELGKEVAALQSERDSFSEQIKTLQASRAQEDSARTEIATQLADLGRRFESAVQHFEAESAGNSSVYSSHFGELSQTTAVLQSQLTQIRESLSAMQKSAAGQPPLGGVSKAESDFSPVASISPSIRRQAESADSVETTTEKRVAGPSALASYSLVRVVDKRAELMGPDGAIVVSSGQTFGDGIKILKISTGHGRMRVVTDRGVLTGKNSDDHKLAAEAAKKAE